MLSCIRKILIGISLTISFVQVISAQSSISGVVADSINNPLYYTTVVLKKDTTTIGVAITDSLGKFKFDSLQNVEYTLIFTRIGFKEKIVSTKLTNNVIMKYILKSDNSLLSNVTVSSTRELARKADRFIFTPDKILTEGNTAAELLRQVPLVRYDERSNAISLIGRPGTKIYINNRNTEIPSAMLAEILRAMPASNIKSIDLITNPGSEYSANTTGGVININLKRQLNEGWLGTLSILTSQGYYNRSILSSYLNYRKGRIGVQLTPSISKDYNLSSGNTDLQYTNGSRTLINTRYLRNYSVLGTGLKIDFDINKKDYLSYNGWLSGVSGKSNLVSETIYGVNREFQVDSTEVLKTKGNDRFIYNYGNINYHRKIDSLDKRYVDANIDYNHFYQKRTNLWGVDGIEQYGSILPQKFFNVSAKLQYRHSLKDGANFITGFQTSLTKTDNDQTYNQFGNASNSIASSDVHYKYDEKYYALYGSFSKTFNKKWNTKVGLRMEGTTYTTAELSNNIRADSNYIKLFPDAGLSFSPNPTNQFSLNFAKKISRPNIELLFPGRTYISNDYFMQNNPFLQPIILNRVDFTYMLKYRYIFMLTYQATKNNFSNFIIPIEEDQRTKLQSTYLNYGKTRNLSASVNFQQPVVKNLWTFYFTGSFNHTVYDGIVSNIPIEKVNNAFGVYFFNTIYLSKKKKWTAFATFNYSDKSTDISGVRAGFSTLDLEVKKVIKDFSINLSASDIYNGSSNIRKIWFGNNTLRENIQYSMTYPRVITLRVVYTFGNQRVQSAKDRSSANDDIRKRVN